ncbi:transketolase 1 [bacterium BMS3Bbin02]|nr:transketolase 1 [bacterium BMS3Bbin02]
MSQTVEQRAANAIRTLSIDAVQKANSGHPGAPMGMADMAVVLWTKFLKVDPSDPLWIDRDRFVLSAGHASMLLYSTLHLAGFPITMDDIKAFRQWGSVTAGHPEIDHPLGIEMTTGPLGQGFATGVGMAMAEEHLRAVFGPDLVDHRTYGFVSDGDLMEGVTSEAASLAGHQQLGKIVYLYDDNSISLVGPTSWSFSEDIPKKFDAIGWHTLTVDGHDHRALAEAIAAGNAETGRPTLISCKTHIGFGSPNKQDSAAAHGSPLGDEEIALTKENLGWDLPPFSVPDDVKAFFADALAGRTAEHIAWQTRLAEARTDADVASLWDAHFSPNPVTLPAPPLEAGAKKATRALSGDVIQGLAQIRPDVVGGSADLASSNNTQIKDSGDFAPANRTARNIRFGVREHAMGAITNGLVIHGGVRAFSGTFLQFSDYMRGAVRLGALMGVPAVWVFTHDSIFLGEDGPTHQPVEHVAALRAIPNLWVIRPADAGEAAGAWQVAMNRTDGPTALILTRQGVAEPSQTTDPAVVGRGAHIVREGSDVVIIATGSEVSLARDAADLLADGGVSARVVSMPCVEAFDELSRSDQKDIIGRGTPRVSLEAGVTQGWAEITGRRGLRIGIDTFGASAPAGILAEQYGFTADAVAERIDEFLKV